MLRRLPIKTYAGCSEFKTGENASPMMLVLRVNAIMTPQLNMPIPGVMNRQTCMNDIARFCRETNPEQGGILKCLKSHGNEISAPCRESIKAMEE
jgi:hypothetical protein